MRIHLEWLSFAASPLVAASTHIAPTVAGLSGRATPSHSDFLVAALVVTTCVFGLLCCGFGAWQRARVIDMRNHIRAEMSMSQSALLLRDSILAGGRESIVVMGADLAVPLCFGAGGALLQECMAGPDAQDVAHALDMLLSQGHSFKLAARAASGRSIALRGMPVGRQAAIFLDEAREISRQDVEARKVLGAVPAPLWLSDKSGALTWANEAFLAMVDADNIYSARLRESLFVESAAQPAGDGDAAGRERRTALVDGRLHSFSVRYRSVPGVGTLATANDVTEAEETAHALECQRSQQSHLLSHLNTGIAIFGADRRLKTYNPACAHAWNLSCDWLDKGPKMEDVLEELRATRRLPESRDFQAWKQNLMRFFTRDDGEEVQLWHLPRQESLRVTIRPGDRGGVLMIFEDVSENLKLSGMARELSAIQNVILDALPDAAAVFGPDGRLQLFNTLFLEQWRLPQSAAQDHPHVNAIAEHAASRFGRDSIWPIVISGVISDDPKAHNDWSTVARSDGTVIAVAMTRLPAGSTLVTLADETNRLALETYLRGSGSEDCAA